MLRFHYCVASDVTVSVNSLNDIFKLHCALKIKVQETLSSAFRMQENCSAAGAPPDPAGRAYSAPEDLLTGGEGAGYPLPKKPTIVLGRRPFTAYPPVYWTPHPSSY